MLMLVVILTKANPFSHVLYLDKLWDFRFQLSF